MIEVPKSLEDSSQLYKTPEDPHGSSTTVMTLECTNNSLKPTSPASENVKLESLEAAAHDRSAVSTGPLPSTTHAATSWTPLTPPQSALQ